MKVYEIKELGETTHFCFNGNKKEALNWYVNETMCDKSEISSLVILPRKKWEDITINFNEYEVEPFSITIYDFMVGCKTPEVICSTYFI